MPSENVELVMNVFGVRLGPEVDIDLFELFGDESLLERQRAFIDERAPIEFATPDGGLLGAMGGPFFGAQGLNEGWAEWLGPWESYSLRSVEIEEGEGKVLLLARCVGRMARSGLEVDTPVAALYDIEDGKVVRLRHFLDQDQARTEANLGA